MNNDSELFFEMSMDINDPKHIFINNFSLGSTKIVRDGTKTNLNYWFIRCCMFFIFETNKFEERTVISKESLREFIKTGK